MTKPQDGRIPKQDKPRTVVKNRLNNDGFAAMILTDVYIGTVDAKTKMHFLGWSLSPFLSMCCMTLKQLFYLVCITQVK